MSSKNLIQEYCQKNNLNIPVYKTERVGGEDHKPIFISSLIFNDKEFKSSEWSSKKAAELEVAGHLFNFLISIKKEVVIKNSEDNYNYFIFVDAENVDLKLEDIYSEYFYYIFFSKNTTKKWQYDLDNRCKNVKLF